MGADGIITNRPDALAAVVAARGRELYKSRYLVN